MIEGLFLQGLALPATVASVIVSGQDEGDLDSPRVATIALTVGRPVLGMLHTGSIVTCGAGSLPPAPNVAPDMSL